MRGMLRGKKKDKLGGKAFYGDDGTRSLARSERKEKRRLH